MLRSSARRRMSRARSPLSCSSRPAAGSSSSTTDGTRRDRPCDADQPAPAVRELVGGVVEVGLELELPHRGHGGGCQVVVARPEEVGHPRHRRRDEVAAGADVLLDADVLEQLERLERAPEPEARALRRVQPVDAAAVERDRSTTDRHEPRHRVDERRLARAVRSDQPDHLSRPDLHRHVVERHDRTEPNGQTGERQRGCRHGLDLGRRKRPAHRARGNEVQLLPEAAAVDDDVGDAVLVHDQDHEEDQRTNDEVPLVQVEPVLDDDRPEPPIAFGAPNTAPRT